MKEEEAGTGGGGEDPTLALGASEPKVSLSGLILKEGSKGNEVQQLAAQLRSLGYWDGELLNEFTPKLTSVVRWFQATNLDTDGKVLVSDGWVGEKTAWALLHSSAETMRQNLFASIPRRLSAQRENFIQAVLRDHARGTREMPEGANSGDGVDRFLAGKGPIPWCMAAVSQWWRDAQGHYPFSVRHTGVLNFWDVAKKSGVAFSRKSGVPAPGDLVIWDFGRGQGHVAVLIAVDKDPRFFTSCGGNESNSVRLRNRDLQSEKNIIGYVRLAGDTGAGHEKGILCLRSDKGPLLVEASR